MVRADLRKAETDTWKADIGRVVVRCREMLGWSLKEFAAKVQRDERQCSRWENGGERVQLDAIFAVKELRAVFVIAIAEAAGEEVERETTIRIRRRA